MDYELLRHNCDPEIIRKYSAFLSSPFVSSTGFFDERRTTPDYLNWQYFMNPAGKAIGYSALYNGSIVGHFSALPIQCELFGEVRRGLLALNLVTDPAHRGKGIFLAVAGKTLEDACSEGFDFCLGVANQNSTHGLTKRLGFSLISPLTVSVGYGNMEIDNDQAYSLKPIWGTDALNWRLSNPSAKYYLSKERYIIAPTGRFGIYAQVKQLEDLQAGIISKESSVNKLRVWIGLGKTSRSIFHYHVPGFLRPVPLNLIFRNFRDEQLIPGKKDVRFELIDFDAY